MSYFRTAILLAAMTALFMGIGFMIGGQGGMIIAFLVAAGMNLFAYWNSDKMVLRCTAPARSTSGLRPSFTRMMRRSRRSRPADAARLHHGEHAAERLRHRAAIRRTARSRSRPACCRRSTAKRSRASSRTSSRHIKNRDTLLMTVTATIAGAISMLANVGMFFGGKRQQ